MYESLTGNDGAYYIENSLSIDGNALHYTLIVGRMT